MKSKTTRHGLKRMTALLLAVVLCVGMVPTAFAAQQDSYHDPAENWQEANNRTNELDANATVTHETFNCKVCKQQTSFIVFRTPEYTRDGQTAMSRNVKYSDGTFVDGSGKGSILDGVPGQDAYYTAYHWTKAVCETCGSINTNMAKTDYGYLKNVYWLYDCANNFFEELPETQTIEQADSEYHRVITTSGEYCGFCYGTFKEENSTLERHHMENAIRPELAHDRFVEMDTCADCGYAETSYTAAKAVIADYFGVVDGQPHTVTVSDLSEAGVTTAIRYGHSADACTLTSAPNYTGAGAGSFFPSGIYIPSKHFRIGASARFFLPAVGTSSHTLAPPFSAAAISPTCSSAVTATNVLPVFSSPSFAHRGCRSSACQRRACSSRYTAMISLRAGVMRFFCSVVSGVPRRSACTSAACCGMALPRPAGCRSMMRPESCAPRGAS